MSEFEVPEPILNSPFEEPREYGILEEIEAVETVMFLNVDTHARVASFAKNAGPGLAIPYLHNGSPHDFLPDFVIRLKAEPERHLILETKGYDPLAEVKAQAAQRWADAVNADGRFGRWAFAMARRPEDVRGLLDRA